MRSPEYFKAKFLLKMNKKRSVAYVTSEEDGAYLTLDGVHSMVDLNTIL